MTNLDRDGDEGRRAKMMAAAMAAVDVFLAEEASGKTRRPASAWRLAPWRPMRGSEPVVGSTWRGRD